jgi:ketosteroid isomerase-like protein
LTRTPYSVSFLLALVFIAIPGFGQHKQRPASSNAPQQQQTEDDKAAIEKLHEEDIQASLALDVPKIESLWTNDIVTMAPGGPALVGRDANEKKLEADAAKLKTMQILAFDEQWQEVRIQGDWAYEWGSMSGRMQPFSAGQETDYKYNVMRVLNRQPDGTWKIARSIYNDAKPAEEPKPAESPKQEQKKDRLKD